MISSIHYQVTSSLSSFVYQEYWKAIRLTLPLVTETFSVEFVVQKMSLKTHVRVFSCLGIFEKTKCQKSAVIISVNSCHQCFPIQMQHKDPLMRNKKKHVTILRRRKKRPLPKSKSLQFLNPFSLSYSTALTHDVANVFSIQLVSPVVSRVYFFFLHTSLH